jgi:cytochrome bd ubiquinol oxidase subunit II
MPELTSALLIALVAMLALNAYALLAGADFGGGVWDLLATGPRRDQQRRLIANAMGPVWEANHVWLILVVVLLFTCFPAAFSRLAIILHIPLSLMLIGIVLRGSAFTFRSYDFGGDHTQRRWGRVFAVASIITPMLLGIMIGALASGRVVAPAAFGDGSPAGFLTVYVRSWLSPFTIAVGCFALTLFAFLAAVYLTVEARDTELKEDFRTRALVAGFAVFLAAGLALMLSSHDETGAPLMWHGLVRSRWAVAFHLLTALTALVALTALWRRRYQLARVAAGAQVSLILWGWALAQFPYLVPPDLTIERTAAPAITLRLVLGALIVGGIVLVPSLYYLFKIFKSERAMTEEPPH